MPVTCRWKAIALRQGEWASWFDEQMKTANKQPEKGLYISLRMDGRVRGSGVGSPPWDRLAVALPPVSGNCHALRQHFPDCKMDTSQYFSTSMTSASIYRHSSCAMLQKVMSMTCAGCAVVLLVKCSSTAALSIAPVSATVNNSRCAVPIVRC